MTDFKTINVSFVIPVREDGHILLGVKKIGLGVGKLTLFGGKLESGETPQQAMLRELNEEASVKPVNPVKLGRLVMDIQSENLRIIAYIYKCSGVIGDPRESYEMTVEWVPSDSIPYDRMWADNKHWMPFLLAGTPFEGEFTFADPDTMIHGSCRPRTPRNLTMLVESISTSVVSPRLSYASAARRTSGAATSTPTGGDKTSPSARSTSPASINI